MAEYVLFTEIKTSENRTEWWQDLTKSEENVQIFKTFEEAKSTMRKTIKRIAHQCDFFPLDKDGKYTPIEEYAEYGDDDIALLGKIICNTINKPSYVYKDVKSLDIQDTDDGDLYFAFVGNEDLILADYYGKTLKTNVHNMSDPNNSYFFIYNETYDGNPINFISVRLLSTAKKKKKAVKEMVVKNYETVTFGRYTQGKDGEETSPLSWRVLEKREDMALLITEKVVDHIQFSARGNNDWETSDLRKWLNTEFANRAFDDREKAAICEGLSGEHVFLISLEEYKKYFSSFKDARAEATEYSIYKRCEANGCSPKDPYLFYGFWWLRTPNKNGGWGEGADVYVCHVCNDGDVNPFERGKYQDGVRPAIWVKLSAITNE